MKFDNGATFYVKKDDNNSLSTFSIDQLLTQDFTYCIKFKPDWDKLRDVHKLTKPGDWITCGLLVRNGAHFGIQLIYGIGDEGNEILCFEGIVWTEGKDGIESQPLHSRLYTNSKASKEIISHANEEDLAWDDFDYNFFEWETDYELTLTSDYENRKLDLMVGLEKKILFTQSLSYGTPMADYTNSWLWVGSSNGFSGCAENNFYYGEISAVGIFSKILDIPEIITFYENTDDLSKLKNRMNSVALFDFNKVTRFKCYDESGHGNHLTLFKESWLTS